MKWLNMPMSNVMPCMIISAMEQATSLRALPDICTVAHKGTTKPATSSLTPILIVWRRVTGIVAADDDVPSAVKYAGIMVQSILNGFLRANNEAIQYWKTRMNTWMPKITAMTFANDMSIVPTCPDTVMVRNIPKI